MGGIIVNGPRAQGSLKKMLLLSLIANAVDPKTLIGFSVLNAVRSKDKPVAEILRYLREQGEDNPDMMIGCIGEELFNKLKETI